jgi:hypothetical protein
MEQEEREKTKQEEERTLLEQDQTEVHELANIELDIEKDLGEESEQQQEVIGRMKKMLSQSRKQVNNIETAFISELVAYKVPPEAVYKTIRAAMLILGHPNAELQKWEQCKKLLRNNFLRQLSNYDPTAIQKESKFRLAKEELKDLDYESCLKRGSVPTATVFDFTLLAIELFRKSEELRHLSTVPSKLRTTFSPRSPRSSDGSPRSPLTKKVSRKSLTSPNSPFSDSKNSPESPIDIDKLKNESNRKSTGALNHIGARELRKSFSSQSRLK